MFTINASIGIEVILKMCRKDEVFVSAKRPPAHLFQNETNAAKLVIKNDKTKSDTLYQMVISVPEVTYSHRKLNSLNGTFFFS